MAHLGVSYFCKCHPILFLYFCKSHPILFLYFLQESSLHFLGHAKWYHGFWFGPFPTQQAGGRFYSLCHYSSFQFKSDITTTIFNNNQVKQHANNYGGTLEQPIRTCSASVSPARQTVQDFAKILQTRATSGSAGHMIARDFLLHVAYT